ncbi:polyprenyl synthetase family protein [Streptomyces sp. NBC_00536]|uniref:polyprenyl synthetase family protein n=1 Tax=Streptomyces sp. NBC_00536 TaxID=2975769 RepID=UPI002E81A440|nr:polyprenyl synthetase family protein [Streptomyces sp. NBC_00536]WUC77787.1 polyprenyl synthetase family protein [Streptomyces sp. NBC_00536]
MSAQTGPPATTLRAILLRSQRLVEPALRKAVLELHPAPGRIVSHAFGWCDEDGTPTDDQGGKGLRQALAVLGAEAVGAAAEVAVPAAVAIELVHAFSLMHDDIMDGDERRRHRASSWKAFGTGPAVLAGDALFALAIRTLAEAPGDRGGAALRQLTVTLGELVHGQADDLLFENRPWTGPGAVDLAEYRAMAERKTGSLLGSAMSLGAVLAGAPPEQVAALSRAARQWGVAFQGIDDLLGIWGDPRATGKPAHSDLRRRKKTLPVLAAISQDPAAGPRLAELLGGEGPAGEAEVRSAARLVEEAGGRAYALTEARRLLDAVFEELYAAPLATPAVDEFVALSESLLRHAG